MNRLTCQAAILAAVLTGGFILPSPAQSLDQIGVTLLRSVTTNLDGSGIRVAQPEAGYDQVTNWEVNPAASLVQQPAGLLTYISADGSTTNFPNSLSSESTHAGGVAGNFYGITGGVATNVAHVDNFDANYFLQMFSNADSLVVELPSTNINDPVVNQSFVFLNRMAVRPPLVINRRLIRLTTITLRNTTRSSVRALATALRRGSIRRRRAITESASEFPTEVRVSGRQLTMAAPSRTSLRPAMPPVFPHRMSPARRRSFCRRHCVATPATTPIPPPTCAPSRRCCSTVP